MAALMVPTSISCVRHTYYEAVMGRVGQHNWCIAVMAILPVGMLCAVLAFSEQTHLGGNLYVIPQARHFQRVIPPQQQPFHFELSRFHHPHRQMLFTQPVAMEVSNIHGDPFQLKSFHRKVMALFAGCLALLAAIVCWPLNIVSRVWSLLGQRRHTKAEEATVETLATSVKVDDESSVQYPSTLDDVNNIEDCDLLQLEVMYLDALHMHHRERIPIVANKAYDDLKLELSWRGSHFPTLSQEKIAFLQASLQHARGSPIMADAEYDALKAKVYPSLDRGAHNFLHFTRQLRHFVEGKSGKAKQRQKPGEAEVRSSLTMEEFTRLPGTKIMMTASKELSTLVTESDRPGKGLLDYVRLPPSQYSTTVLRAKVAHRIGPHTFSCELEDIDFLGMHITPVLVANVTLDVERASSSIDVIDCHIKRRANAPKLDKYFVLSQNLLQAVPTEHPLQKRLLSQCTLKVGIVKPRWLLLPVKLAESMGSAIVQAVMNTMAEDFMVTIVEDYHRWATDDPKRIVWSM